MLKLIKYSPFLKTVVCRKYSVQAFKPFYKNFFETASNVAVIDRLGCYQYHDILYTSYLIAKRIKSLVPSGYENNERIAFLCPNEAIYVSVLLACWISGNVAVPLSDKHPKPLLEYMIKNSQSSLVIVADSVSDNIKDVASKLELDYLTVNSVQKTPSDSLKLIEKSQFFSWNSELSDRNALIIYTSGTTGTPKGVVLTHGNLFAQVSSLVKAWEISAQDVILHTLPLYHVHGIMNALMCILNVGGTVVMRPKFSANEVWNYLINQNLSNPKVSLFFGVPTMYALLIESFNKIEGKEHIRKSCEKNIRLMTSGSAPLPNPVFHKWESITGHFLLERFGMSEIGMALSNPLNGPRLPGTVGNPLPGVEVKVVENSSVETSVFIQGNNSGVEVLPDCEEKTGELLIKGPTVFKNYWNNEKATLEAFTKCGWFKTGDVAAYESGSFKILGRMSADIIKSGGYKISALPIESHLLSHPDIIDCAVLGVPDEIWGERVAAVLATKNKRELGKVELKTWCEKILPTYSVPSLIKYIDVIPRNPMGKEEFKNYCLNEVIQWFQAGRCILPVQPGLIMSV